MANNVFANGREISCKSGSGKSIAAFPDVCMTPPENPATPPGVPVPYPNTGNTSDCTSGSTTVKISDKEAMLKNKSYFKKSMGDEAGSAAKKGVVTSVNRGKVYFTAWSMDVKIEGENAVRHLDMTTHNHGSTTNTPPWPFIDSGALGDDPDPCKKEKEAEEEACKDAYDEVEDEDGKKSLVFNTDKFNAICAQAGLDDTYRNTFPGSRDKLRSSSYGDTAGDVTSGNRKGVTKAVKAGDGNFIDKESSTKAWEDSQDNDCLKARRCKLVPYKPSEQNKKDGAVCCPAQTGHHVVDKSYCKSFKPAYSDNAAPCVCTEGGGSHGSHGAMHAKSRSFVVDSTDGLATGTMKYEDIRDNAIKDIQVVFFQSGCSKGCMEAQLDEYHNKCGISEGTDLDVSRARSTGRSDAASQAAAQYADDRAESIAMDNAAEALVKMMNSCPFTGAPGGGGFF